MPRAAAGAALAVGYLVIAMARRGRLGHGRALWHAAADWGHHHGAAYQLLQTQPRSTL